MTRFRVVLVVIAMCAALGGGGVHAAARFDHATPAPGSVLTVPPDRVDIYTVRPTSPRSGDTQVVVLNGDRRRLDHDDSTVDPEDHHHIWVTLESNLPAGRYVVSFKTRGDVDYDHDGGEYAFYVGVQPTSADRAADAALSLTTLGGEDVLHGYQRGLVEGLAAVSIGGPVALYLVYRHYQKRKAHDGERLPTAHDR